MMSPAAFRRLRLPAAALALVLAAVPAASQTSLDDPLDARDAKRLDRMEKVLRELRSIVFASQKNSGVPIVVQPADTDARLQDLSARINDIEQTLVRMNGSIETTGRDLDQARRDNAALQAQVKALNDRLAAMEAPPPPPVEASPAGPGGGPAQKGAAEAFAEARKLMMSGDYDAAEAAFSDYVGAYPDSPRAPEARYWWGKTLVVKGQEARAATAFIGAIRGWPQTPWAPDALVELARSLVALKKPADACQTLAELPRRYPKASAAVQSRAAAARTQAKCS